MDFSLVCSHFFPTGTFAGRTVEMIILVPFVYNHSLQSLHILSSRIILKSLSPGQGKGCRRGSSGCRAGSLWAACAGGRRPPVRKIWEALKTRRSETVLIWEDLVVVLLLLLLLLLLFLLCCCWSSSSANMTNWGMLKYSVASSSGDEFLSISDLFNSRWN